MAIRDKRIISLDMLGDVEITEPVGDNDGIWYDEESGQWVNGLLAHNDTIQRDAADAHPITAIEQFAAVDDQPVEPGTAIVWTGTEWQSLNLFSVAGYGGVAQATPIGLPDIGTGWTTLLADSVVVSVPRGVTQDPANNGLHVLRQGVWQLSIYINLAHNESNSGRETNVRIFNQTTGGSDNETPLAIGRNQPGLNFSLTAMFEIPLAEVSDLWQVQVGGGDALTSVVENSFRMELNYLSEYRG